MLIADAQGEYMTDLLSNRGRVFSHKNMWREITVPAAKDAVHRKLPQIVSTKITPTNFLIFTT